jgi:PAS domain S-box-containing protein
VNEAALAAPVAGDEPLAAACVVAWSWAAAAEQAPCLDPGCGWTIHPDDMARLGAAGETALAGGDGPFLCEHRVRDAAGQVRWVESRGRVVRGGDGDGGRIVGASIDVTRRRQREDELRASAERRRLLAEVTAEGVCLHDGLHLLEANESLARMFGYGSAAEMVGLPISALPATEWVATGLARVAARFEGAYTLLGRRKDGSTFPIELSAREVGLDGQRLRAGRIRDVSEHKAAEAALRESEERLRLAVEVAGLGIFDVDPGTGERRWSPEFKAILGLPPDTRPDPELYGSLIHPADQAWVNQRYWSTFRGERGGLYDVEYRILRASDGALRWVHNTGRVFFGPDGRAGRAVGTLLDITDRKTAEEALLAAETVRRAASEQARRRLEAVIEGIAEAVTAVFPKEDVWLRNAAWLPIHGFASFEELPGHYVSDFSHLFDVRFADGSAMARLDWAVTRVLEGQSFSDLEVRLRRLDKEHERWVSYNGTAVRDPDGSVALAILTMRDITARNKAEERQALLLAELLHRVKNTLAVVQGIAARSLAADRPPAEGREAFTKRPRSGPGALAAHRHGMARGQPAGGGGERAAALWRASGAERAGADAGAEGGPDTGRGPARAGDQRRQARRPLGPRGPGGGCLERRTFARTCARASPDLARA